MVRFATRNVRSKSKTVALGILGLTPALAISAVDSPEVESVTLIDQADVIEESVSSKVERVTANWLEPSGRQFDSLVGDEVLNNLTVNQYPMFFERCAEMLEPGSSMVLRTLGRFKGSEPHGFRTEDELVDFIRGPAGQLSANLLAAELLVFLGSPDIAFDAHKQEINTGKYHELLSSLLRSGRVTHAELERAWFPSRDNRTLRLSFPKLSSISEACHPWFSLMPLIDIDSSYAPTGHPLRQLYKIVRFQRN
jgi:hypothetical protein